jgi:chromosome transmission fidelity protein 18
VRCGCPGIGKTTLAHVLARHAGFRPVEINASDERTAPALTRRLLDAAEMRPLLDAEQRPNAIIIDEVDGATGRGGDTGRVGTGAEMPVCTLGPWALLH